MAYSFYTSPRDADLNAGSNTFAGLILDDPTTYGLTAADASAYSALNAAWNSAYAAATALGSRSRVLVQAKNDARKALVKKAAELAKAITGNSAVTDTQRVALGLNVRKKPSPVTTLGTPHTFKASLLQNGAVQVGWKCTNPRAATGTTYQVYRRVGTDGVPEIVGLTGTKQIVDAAIPAGATSITYQVQATRSTGAGDWAQFNVTFGTAPNGGTTMSIDQSPAKRAA
ncbi:MAG: hypothetical protein ACTHLN_09295 [Tepidisphaeraceae bacterium]